MSFQLRTKHGYDFYEVASAFQKAIRRADEESALFWGAELWESKYIDYAWKRMAIMCSEDIGLGEPSCIVQFMALRQSHELLIKLKEKDNALPFFHAIILLVRCRKSRYVDHAVTVYFDKIERERRAFKDYDYDNHTRTGKAMGRGLDFFYNESAKIHNANKIKGEEELEQIALKVDNVKFCNRQDIPVSDDELLAIEKRGGQLSLF